MKEAILIVDAQNDFFPNGALAVTEGDQIIDPICKLLNQKRIEYSGRYPVFLTQDWHPAETKHFQSGGGVWPPHCVENTKGAEIREEIHNALLGFKINSDKLWVKAFRKGTDPEDDGGYSGFDGIGEGRLVQGQWKPEAGRPLVEELTEEGVTDLIVCGLATDYCVRATVLDALKHRFRVHLLLEGIAAVNLSTHDGEKALTEMLLAGAVPYSR